MSFFLEQTVNGLVLGSVYALFALGFSLVLANLRVFNVAHEAIITWGALGMYGAVVVLHLPWPIAALVAAVVAGLIDVFVYLVAIRHLRRRPDRELAGFISSLGALIALAEVANLVLNREVVRLPFDAFPFHTVTAAPLPINTLQVAFITAAGLALVILWWLLQRTQFGREIRATAYSPEIAGTIGVDVERVTVSVFLISGACAGLGAALVGTAFNVIDGGLGARYSLMAIAVTIIGGFGSLPGAAVGGLLVGLISSWTTAYWTTSYRDVVVFSAMLGLLWLRPKGLFGSVLESPRA